MDLTRTNRLNYMIGAAVARTAQKLGRSDFEDPLSSPACFPSRLKV